MLVSADLMLPSCSTSCNCLELSSSRAPNLGAVFIIKISQWYLILDGLETMGVVYERIEAACGLSVS